MKNKEKKKNEHKKIIIIIQTREKQLNNCLLLSEITGFEYISE